MYSGNARSGMQKKKKKKITPFMYIDDKGICKKWKSTGGTDINNKNIQLGYRSVIWQRKMSHVHNKKMVKDKRLKE